MAENVPTHDLDMVGIIDYLGTLLGEWFENDVSYIYFGKMRIWVGHAGKSWLPHSNGIADSDIAETKLRETGKPVRW